MDITFALIFWEALKDCGMDYVTVSLADIAMPFIREQTILLAGDSTAVERA